MIGAATFGQHLAEHDPAVRRAQRTGRLDELLLAQGQHLPAHDTGDVGPAEQADHVADEQQPGFDDPAEAPVSARARTPTTSPSASSSTGSDRTMSISPRDQRVDLAPVEARRACPGSRRSPSAMPGREERDEQRGAGRRRRTRTNRSRAGRVDAEEETPASLPVVGSRRSRAGSRCHLVRCRASTAREHRATGRAISATMMMTMKAPPIANLSLRNRRQNSSHGERPMTCCDTSTLVASGSMGASGPVGEPRARCGLVPRAPVPFPDRDGDLSPRVP